MPDIKKPYEVVYGRYYNEQMARFSITLEQKKNRLVY